MVAESVNSIRLGDAAAAIGSNAPPSRVATILPRITTLARLPSETTTIRRCSHDDVDAVLGLWELARSGHASTPDRREDVERLVKDSPAALLVAETAGQIVGAVIAGWDGWRGNIYRLAVQAEYRRQGIGMQLTEAAENYLRSRGVHRVTALVAYDDGAAGSFWDAAGYPQDADIGRRVRNI
jgi:ribosomal protein S18 acetylase RimI-like enzyme